MTRITIAALAALILSQASPAQGPPRQGQSSGPPMVGKVEYKKLDTREATEARILSLLNPNAGAWGPFYVLEPFDFDRQKGPKLADVAPPEAELEAMKPGGPGPNLQAEYTGKLGTKATWKPIGDRRNKEVNLYVFDDDRLDNFAIGYVYTTITVERPVTMNVTMGSDDALRLWLNGRLLVDEDVERGLDPESTHVKLDLHAGVNHLLAKVGNVQGGWAFQVNTSAPLDPQLENQLQYLLNLDFPNSPEDEYYKPFTISIPADIVMEVGGLDVLPPDKSGRCRPIACTRRGEVWIIENAYDEPAFNCRFKRFASGLHEPLGLAVRLEKDEQGKPRTAVYCTQRGELTRLIDTDGDDQADVYETFCDFWGVSGNYHEFAFGPKFDREGNAWVTLNVGFCGSLGKSITPYRGWALKIAPDGKATPWCDGLRSPNGIGEFTDGTMFYWDNQGDYVGTNRMMALDKGCFAGHPAGLRWRQGYKEGDPAPARQPATIWLPYKKMGQSGADFLLYAGNSQIADVANSVKASKFGPFEGQVFVGDQTLCLVSRVCLEKVDGVWQGAAFPFRSGLDCGVNRLCWGGDGSMFIGQTDRGWGSIGRLRYGVQRLAWTGKVPFEIHTMRAKPDGFELEFTKDVDPRTAADPASYSMLSYTYEYHAAYGSDEMDKGPAPISSVQVTGPRTVRLVLDKLKTGDMGYVYELKATGVRDGEGRPLLHTSAFYTLQRVPSQSVGQMAK